MIKKTITFALFLLFLSTNSFAERDCSTVKYDKDEWQFESKKRMRELTKLQARADDRINIGSTFKDDYTGDIHERYKVNSANALILSKKGSRISNLNVDHIIPRKWMHENGGCNWSPAKKKAFANNPKNLKLITDSSNKSKGAKGPDKWLPKKVIDQVKYIKLWREVAGAYDIPEARFNKLYGAKVLQALKQSDSKGFSKAMKALKIGGRVVIVVGGATLTYDVGSSAYQYYMKHYVEDDSYVKLRRVDFPATR